MSHEPLDSSGLVYMITAPSMAKVDLTGDTVGRTLSGVMAQRHWKYGTWHFHLFRGVSDEGEFCIGL